jgi:glycine/D-amino acid oxidase-like deaminating enzyme
MISIVIVGTGVLGLSTGLAICECLSEPFTLTIIGEYGPHDPDMNTTLSNYTSYTSPWAGAHFRPFPSKSVQEYNEMLLTRITQKRFRQFAEENPETSIRFVKGAEYLEDPDHWYSNITTGWKNDMANFQVISKDLPPGVKLGVKYDTWVVNSPLYLQFLYRKLANHYNVKFVKAKLTSLEEVNQFVAGNPIIINCSGTGLQYDGGYDKQCYPIRGQTLLIRPPKSNTIEGTITHQLKDGKWTFCIPRPFDGGMILGGTKQVNDTNEKPKESDTKELIEGGRKLFPQLFQKDGSLDIMRVNVGFRPARNGGLNLSVEATWKTNHQNHVINNYGAGGMGYELSYGSGIKVVEGLQQLLIEQKIRDRAKI